VDSLSRVVAHWIAVAGGLGYVPAAPGTAGSAAGALLFLLVFGIGTGASWLGGAGIGPLTPIAFQIAFGTFVGSFLLVGVWASGRAERDFGCEDDARIVIDEVVGQLIALAPLLALVGVDSTFLTVGVGVVTGFVLFRLFDIWKPGAVRWAERRFDGGTGVMADDLVAGVYAAIALIALALAAEALSPASGGLSVGGGLSMGGGLLMSGGLLMGGGLS
jgi:phosphatidylglycerophosphatase A